MAAKRGKASVRRAAATVTLWDMPYSHHCIKVRKLLAHKGVAHDTRLVPYHDKRALLAATGQDYVPYLHWDGRGVPWGGIVEFLEEQVPEPSAFPPGLKGQARMLEQWAHDVLEERVWRYVVPDFGPIFKDEQERWVFEEIQFWKRGPMEALKARQPQAREDMLRHLRFVEDALERSDFLLGDLPCVADFAVHGALYPLRHVGKQVPRELPRLRAWDQRVGKV